MGVLSMNPDGEARPYLARQIAEKEDWVANAPEIVEEPEEKEPPKKMKLGPFELDISYPRTFQGLIRMGQVLLMLIAFVCLVIAPEWPDQGSYTFFCVFLIFGVFLSGYLFFSIIADQREEVCCACSQFSDDFDQNSADYARQWTHTQDEVFVWALGEFMLNGFSQFSADPGFSWILLELVYFIAFGCIIFLGSCLAASNSQGMAALTISAICGFAATLTFIYHIWTTWVQRKQLIQKKREEEEKEQEEENEEGDAENQKRPITPASVTQKDQLEIEREIDTEHNSRRPSLNFGKQNNSLPSRFNEKFYENQEFTGKHQRRRHYSASDKDSAYSEGTITPTRGKMIPPKMRRTASAQDIDFDVLHKQPLTHLSHRPYGRKGDHDMRRTTSTHRHLKTGYGYPRELSTHSFTNMGFHRDGSRFDDDDFDPSLKRKKSMPDWLRAALGAEVGTGDNILDDESEIALPSVKRSSTFPTLSPKEFPLLAHSDEESVNYPSVSQHGPGRQFYTMPHKHHGDFPETEFRQPRHHHRHHHHSKRRRGHNRHNKRGFTQHNHHHRRMHHHRHHGHRRDGHGRRPINDEHEDYLRRMVENDELVTRDAASSGKPLRGFQLHNGKPIETGKRRVIPEQTISIQFPEQSRWDDVLDHEEIQNPMMEKYLADAQKMRA